MKIEEVITIYSFLGNISVWGFVGFTVVMNALLCIFFITLKTKLSLKTQTAFISALTVGMSVLYAQAQSKNRILVIGNYIKQDYMTTLYERKYFCQINAVIHSNDSDLVELCQLFPNDFKIELLDSMKRNCGGDSVRGISIIDVKWHEELNNKLIKKSVVTSAQIENYLMTSGFDTLFVNPTYRGQLSLFELDNEGWAINQPFYKTIPRANLQAIHNARRRIIGFRIINRNYVSKDVNVNAKVTENIEPEMK